MSDDATRVLLEAARSFDLQFEDTTPPKDGFLDSHGLRMHYLDWGREGKPPVLFLHGGGLTAHTWDFTCLQLRHDYHCYALDQRGHGDTGHEDEVGADTYVQREDVRGAVEELGLDQFVLVGMSMGGMNTIAYAGEYTKTLKGAVIVDVSPTVREEGAREIGEFVGARPAFASLEEAIEAAHKFNPVRPKEHLKYSLLHNLRHDPDGKWRWKYDRGERPKVDPETFRAERLKRSERLWAEVPKITCPTLVVHGGESRVLKMEDAELLRDRLPDARLVSIPGAGHTVQGDRPKEFAAAVRSFLKEIGY
jgi:pimeloyl-ACP methyl ester carboxylesterase